MLKKILIILALIFIFFSTTAFNLMDKINEVRADYGLPPIIEKEHVAIFAHYRASNYFVGKKHKYFYRDADNFFRILYHPNEIIVSDCIMHDYDFYVDAWMKSKSHRNAILGNYLYGGYCIYFDGSYTYAFVEFNSGFVKQGVY